MTQNRSNVVLVRLANPNMNIITPPIGIGFLLKALKGMDSVNPVFIDCKLENIDEVSLLSRLERLEPLMVGFQVFSVDYKRFALLLPQVRKRLPRVVIVAGGPHVTGLPCHTLEKNPELDFVVVGEGEEALPQLIQYHVSNGKEVDIGRIPNLVYRGKEGCVQNKRRNVDVHTYGPPEWKLLFPERYPPIQHGTFHKSKRVVPILTSRGCPYPCTFCAGHLITGKKIRLRKPEDVVDEIEWLKEKYGFEEFIIEDENFTFYKSHVLQFADELKTRKVKCFFSFPNGVRLDRLDEQIVARMSEMGTYMVLLGIESGSRTTLGKMKKKWNLDLIRRQVDLLRKYGIIVNGAFILGYRDETMEDIEKTIRFALSLPLDTAYFGNYLPLPGTADFDILVKKKELVLDDIRWEDYNSYTGTFPYHPKDVSEVNLRKSIKSATFRFYLRPRIAFGLFRRMTSPVFLRSLFFRMFIVLSRN